MTETPTKPRRTRKSTSDPRDSWTPEQVRDHFLALLEGCENRNFEIARERNWGMYTEEHYAAWREKRLTEGRVKCQERYQAMLEKVGEKRDGSQAAWIAREEWLMRTLAEAPPLTHEQASLIKVIFDPKSPSAETAAFKERLREEQRRLQEAEAARRAAEETARQKAEEERKAASRRCALYRHFDADGQLLYVGISVNTSRRRIEHLSQAPWLRFQATETVEWLVDREAAEEAETTAIQVEQPIFNIRRAVDGSRERRLQYLAKKGAWDMLSENR